MAKKVSKSSPKSMGGLCKTCKSFHWLYAILLLLIALVPRWYGAMWAKWVLVVIAILILLQKKCKCC